MSNDKAVDDIGKILVIKQGEIWWKDWLRNNYQVAVAITDYVFRFGSELVGQQAQSWAGKNTDKAGNDLSHLLMPFS